LSPSSIAIVPSFAGGFNDIFGSIQEDICEYITNEVDVMPNSSTSNNTSSNSTSSNNISSNNMSVSAITNAFSAKLVNYHSSSEIKKNLELEKKKMRKDLIMSLVAQGKQEEEIKTLLALMDA
jgi:hypothetical protein